MSNKVFVTICPDHPDGISILNIERNLLQTNNIYHVSDKIKVRYFNPPVYKE